MFPSSQPLPTSFPLFLELSPYPRFSRCVFTCSHKASLSDNRVTCAPFLYALAPGVVLYSPFRLSSASQILSILRRLDCLTYPKDPGKGQGARKEWSLVPHPLDDSHVSGLHTTFYSLNLRVLLHTMAIFQRFLYWIITFIYVHVYGGINTWEPVPPEARKGHQVTWNWNYSWQWAAWHDLETGNQTRVLCKSREHSRLLRYLSRLSILIILPLLPNFCISSFW